MASATDITKFLSAVETVVVDSALRYDSVLDWLTVHKSSETELADVVEEQLQLQLQRVLSHIDQFTPLRPNDVLLLLPHGQADIDFWHAMEAALEHLAFRNVKVTKQIAEDILIDIPQAAVGGMQQFLAESFTREYWEKTVGVATRDGLRTYIERGINEQFSTPEIADLIEADSSGLFSRARAMRIARTETTTVLNGSQNFVDEALADDPETGVNDKEWVAILDDDVRDAHRAADGQVVPIKEQYVVGGERARFPGDPQLSAGQRINCRCLSLSQ